MSFGDSAARNVEHGYLISRGAGDKEPGAIRSRGEASGREKTLLGRRSRSRRPRSHAKRGRKPGLQIEN